MGVQKIHRHRSMHQRLYMLLEVVEAVGVVETVVVAIGSPTCTVRARKSPLSCAVRTASISANRASMAFADSVSGRRGVLEFPQFL